MTGPTEILNSPLSAINAYRVRGKITPPTEPTERRRFLATALHHEDFPEDFSWDFGEILEPVDPHSGMQCGFVGCAIGLASLIWPEHADMLENGYTTGEQIAEFFDMTPTQVENIFFNGCGFYGVYNYAAIKPSTVAKALMALDQKE